MTEPDQTPSIGLTEALVITSTLFAEGVEIRHHLDEAIGAWHLSQSTHGGISVLVSAEDGTFLFTQPGYFVADRIAEFARGARTTLADVTVVEGMFIVRCRYGTGPNENWDWGWPGASDAPVLLCDAHKYPAGGMAYLGSPDDPCRFWDNADERYRDLFPAQTTTTTDDEGKDPHDRA